MQGHYCKLFVYIFQKSYRQLFILNHWHYFIGNNYYLLIIVSLSRWSGAEKTIREKKEKSNQMFISLTLLIRQIREYIYKQLGHTLFSRQPKLLRLATFSRTHLYSERFPEVFVLTPRIRWKIALYSPLSGTVKKKILLVDRNDHRGALPLAPPNTGIGHDHGCVCRINKRDFLHHLIIYTYY